MHLGTLIQVNSAIFKNRKWQNATYYEFGNEHNLGYYSRAYLVKINKTFIKNKQEGFIYLLQRMCYELENWDASEEWTLTNFQFINFVFREGYLVHKQGKVSSKSDFWKSYQQFMPTSDLIQRKKVISVLSFDNRWNSQQYLIETSTKLCYLDWGINS